MVRANFKTNKRIRINISNYKRHLDIDQIKNIMKFIRM